MSPGHRKALIWILVIIIFGILIPSLGGLVWLHNLSESLSGGLPGWYVESTGR